LFSRFVKLDVGKRYLLALTLFVSFDLLEIVSVTCFFFELSSKA